jgi:uncharacterized protein
MAEYLAPGVFLEEVDLKPPSIDGVSTSTTGMVGHTVRGPAIGRPLLVTNMLQFRQNFGGPLPASEGTAGELFYAAQGFFANGGKRLYVARAAGAAAAATRFETRGGFIQRLAAGADVAVGATSIRPASQIGFADGMNISLSMVRDGVTHTSTAGAIPANGINTATGMINLPAITVSPAGPTTYPATATAVISTINGLDANGEPTFGARPDSIDFDAAEPGAWGDGIVITARHKSGARGVVQALVVDPGVLDDNRVRLASGSGFYVGAWVQIDRGSAPAKIFRRVLAVNGPVLTLSGAPMTGVSVAPVAPATQTIITVCEFELSVSYDGITETYPSLTLANVPGKYVLDEVNRRSRLVRVIAASVPVAVADTHPFRFPSGDDGLTLRPTTAGISAAPNAAAIRGTDNGPNQRTGLRALEEIDDISIIAVPGWGDVSVQGAMIEQCERLRYRVALLDPELPVPGVAPTLVDIQNQRRRFDTKYAAIYYPRVIIRDFDDQVRSIGPAGHMAGICARVDNERGVFKAPGNETMRNIIELESIVTKGEHEVLNPQPNNINVIRDFRNEGRGIRIYGARCITSLSDWKYLSVRRLFIQIERSIEIGTQWAVLEPNDPKLWDKLIASIDAFLTTKWREGALLGVEKSDAFYIRCGLDTMTQDDIDNGRLIMEIGIAPVKPAEFIIIRIGQTASGSFATEA